MPFTHPTAPPLRLRILRRAIRLLPAGRNRAIGLCCRSLPADKRLLTSVGGTRVQLAVNFDEYVGRQVFFHGFFEPDVTSVFLQRIAPGMTIFDVGANLGYFSMIAADRTGTGGRVVAFEPDPLSRDRLVENLHLNHVNNTMVEALAAAESSGTVDFCPSDPNKSNHGAATMVAPANYSRWAHSILVPTVSLDEYCDSRGIDHVDVVKMDIEGGEVRAVAGMSVGLATGRYRCVILELHPQRIHECGHAPEQVIDAFTRNGYQCWKISPPDSRGFVKYPRASQILDWHKLTPFAAGTALADSTSVHLLLSRE